MSRVRRILGWVLVAVLVLVAMVLLGVNLYVQSQATHARIQQELSQRLGMPLRIDRISVTPWGGLKLTGITIPQNDQTQPFLMARDFRLRVRFRSIFSQPLVIKEISLGHPAVVWAQTEAGKWRLPLTRPAEEEAEIAEVPPSETQPPAATPIPAPEQKKKIVVTEGRSNTPQIRRIKVVSGSFHFLDHEQKPVAFFEQLNFSSAMRESNAIRGEARIEKIALRDKVFLTGLRSAVHYDPNMLELAEMSAQIAKGRLGGSFSMQPQEPDSPFRVHAAFRQVQADELVAEAGGAREMIQGALEGTLDADGKIADPDALQGNGAITLNNGRMRQFPLLAAIGQILQIEELTQLELDQAEARYRLAGQNVMIDELNLRSPNLRLNANGSASFKGKLALNSTLTINEKVRAQLFRAIRDNFAATSEPGQYALDFHITGTIDRPKTDLVERAIGADLKDFGGVLDALLGRNKAKKKKNPDALASPSPTAP